MFIRGVCLVDHESYDEALGLFDSLIVMYPAHPIGYFGAAATYQTIMRNHRVNAHEAEYDSVLNKAIDVGREALRTYRRDPLVRFYLGGSYGFRGLFKVRKREWFGAFQDGLKGLNALERALDMDPALYDAYYGLGLYHYWRSAKGNLGGIISLFSRDRARGIREIWTAIEKGRYSEVSGKYALVATYYDAGEYEKAWAINEDLFRRFPSNPSCLYMRSRICQRLGYWEEMEKASRSLLVRIREAPYVSVGYEMECFLRIAEAQVRQGRFEEAVINLEKGLQLEVSRDDSKEVEGPLEDLEEIVEALAALKKEINSSPNMLKKSQPAQKGMSHQLPRRGTPKTASVARVCSDAIFRGANDSSSP